MLRVALTALLLFTGCSKKIWTKVYDKRLAKEPISCLSIKSDNFNIENLLKKDSLIKKLYKKKCPYVLKISSNCVSHCSALRAKTLGTDFDGYVRFDIYKKSIHFYRVQRDFKGSLTEDKLKLMVDRMQKDLKFAF